METLAVGSDLRRTAREAFWLVVVSPLVLAAGVHIPVVITALEPVVIHSSENHAAGHYGRQNQGQDYHSPHSDHARDQFVALALLLQRSQA